MNSLIKICFIILSLFLISSTVHAQKDLEDVVYLENGSIIRGKIIEYNKDGNIKIETLGGSILVYPSTDVVKIKKEPQKNRPTKSRKRPNHIPKEKDIYLSIMGGTMLGINEWGAPVPGISAKATLGWHFNRFIGIGGGVGLMILGQESFAPIYANIRSCFMKKSVSLFADVNIGYGLPLLINNSWLRDFKAQGGLYIRPSIGVRLPATRRTHTTLDLGYVIQFSKSFFTDWNGNPVMEKRTFFRPSLRVGITF